MHKPIILLIIATLVLFLSSCDDKEEPTLSLSPSDLVQTSWYGTDTSFDNNQETGTINFILEFLSSSNGTYIFVDEKGDPYGNGSFKYQIKGKIISFSGAIVGDWTIIERNNQRIVLQAFRPQKHIMYLTKMY